MANTCNWPSLSSDLAEKLRADPVAQPVLHADARSQSRIQKAAAEHVIAEQHGRIVGVLVAHIHPLARQRKRR